MPSLHAAKSGGIRVMKLINMMGFEVAKQRYIDRLMQRERERESVTEIETEIVILIL